jgi:hypothetical protein
MHGKGVPEVVHAALHTDLLAQGRKVAPHGLVRNAAAPSVHEERGRRGTTARRHRVDILGEGAREARANRQMSRLIEFRFANQDHPRTEVDVLASERQRFPETESRAVQEQQECAKRRRGDGTALPGLVRIHACQQPTQLLGGVDVRDEGLGHPRDDRRHG